MSIWQQLSAAFAPSEIHWRAQNVVANDNGARALALAYIDARDVMDRLDSVVGPANWQDSYVETAKGRLICQLSIRVDGEWITKSDGAGDTAVEGEKGAMSDAFKRAAVKFGIGRYLYSLGNVWAECDVNKRDNKNYWKAWKPSAQNAFAAALAKVSPPPPPLELSKDDLALIDAIEACDTPEALGEWSVKHGQQCSESPNVKTIRAAYKARLDKIKNPQKKAA